MIPTCEELISLNPRLRNKTKDELDKLIQIIISKGYVWRNKEKYFYHEKIGMHIRTEGLDVFTPEIFLKTYEVWSNQRIAEGMHLGQRYLPKLIWAFIIDLALGWILLPLVFWIFSLFFLLLVMVVIYKIARKNVKFGEKETKGKDETKSVASSITKYPKYTLANTLLALADMNQRISQEKAQTTQPAKPNPTMFNPDNKDKQEKRLVEDYFLVIARLINKIIEEWKDSFNIIKDDTEAFKFEYTALILWLTVQKFANLFDDTAQQNKLIDGIHNEYYALLRKKLGMGSADLQKVLDIFNDRYRAYDEFLPLVEEETHLFKLCIKFAEFVDSYHQTSHKDDLREIHRIGELILMFSTATGFIDKEFIKENYNI